MKGILQSDDGSIARESAHYAKDKLTLVEKYQGIFASGMKNLWPRRVYLDLLAGCGRCRIKDTGEEFTGSPLRSLEAPFTARVFVESHPTLVAALKHRVPAECVILEEDCNAPATIETLRQHCPKGALGLAFVDNLGTDVPMSTLAALTADRQIDLMIVFQVQDFTRNIEETLNGGHDRTRVDDFFGSTAWEGIVLAARKKNASPSEITTALMAYYGERLGAIGYPLVDEARRPMKNRQNTDQYRIMLAAKDARAVDFFRKIQKIEPSGQRSMF